MDKEINANWIVQKEKLKLRFSALTDCDFTYETDKKDEMLERLQIKLGKSKDEIHEIIKQF